MTSRINQLIQKANALLEYASDLDNIEISHNENLVTNELQIFDFDSTLSHDGLPLPCVDILREKLSAGIPCYICTAREGAEHAPFISSYLEGHGISFPLENIFVVGEEPKSFTVEDLIEKHQPELCEFWDDLERNVEDVYKHCGSLVPELKINWLSRAIPGDLRKSIVSNPFDERIEEIPTIAERKIFRRMRKLSGI